MTTQPTHVIALLNQKGGVGKTTTAVNLAVALAGQIPEGAPGVCLVDLDPQAHATKIFDASPDDDAAAVYQVLTQDALPAQAALATTDYGVTILPSSIRLAMADLELASAISRELVLARKLRALRRQYRYILIDCPPTLGLLTLNALGAADYVIIPVQCEELAVEGLSDLLNTIKLVQDRINDRLQILGLVLTMYDRRTSMSQTVAENLRRAFGAQVFETVVPRATAFTHMRANGPIHVYAPGTPGDQAYLALAQEVTTRAR